MSAMEGVSGVELGNDDATKTVLGELATRMGWLGGIKDIPALIGHLADLKGSHPAFTVLNENYAQVATRSEDVLEEPGTNLGLPITIVCEGGGDEIPATLVALTGIHPTDSRFIQGVAYSPEHNGGVYVSLRPNDGGLAYLG